MCQRLNGIEISTGGVKASKSPADKDFRIIASLILKDIMDVGTEGFCIRRGSYLLGIQFGIIGFRADMPANNFLHDSAGRLGSNSPCMRCDYRRRVFDPYLMDYVACIKASMFSQRDKLRSLNSAHLNLDEGSYLRLLPFLMWAKQHPIEAEECLHRGNELVDFQRATSVLYELIQYFPKTPVTLFPETLHVRSYVTGYNSFKPSNHSTTVGWINLGNNTHLKVENTVVIDMMHMFHNVFKVFISILFINPPTKNRADVQSISNALNNARRAVHLQAEDEVVDYFGIDDSIRVRARKRLAMIPHLPEGYDWIPGLVNGGNEPSSITAETKRVFCCSILPYLMIDSMEDPKVWSIVSLLMILGIFHNFDGTIVEAEYYQLLAHLILFVFQMVVPPSTMTLYIHSFVHLSEFYRVYGPLKEGDTFHCEAQYRGLAEEATGGSRPVFTMMSRYVTSKTSALIGFEKRVESPRKLKIEKECPK